jgi:anti-sigma B factor antagonist
LEDACALGGRGTDSGHFTNRSPFVHRPLFRCFVKTAGGVATVKFAGELDMASTPEAEGAFQDALTSGASRIVVDLRDLDFMDSTGLTLLVRWDLGARNDGYDLAVVPGPEPIQRLFRITGLDRHFTFKAPG